MRARAAAVVTAVAMALTTLASAPASHATPSSDHARAPGAAGSPEAADRALARARRIFAPQERRGRRTPQGEATLGAGPGGPDATMVLRELRLRYAALSAPERQAADAFFLRPTTSPADEPPAPGDMLDLRFEGAPATHCTVHVCVQWDTAPEGGQNHAPPLADNDRNGLPDQVDLTAGTFEELWTRVVDEMGYLPPRPDWKSKDRGRDGRLDVYLLDLPDNTYGFCTSDDPSSGRRISAYCVLDDDFDEFAGSPVDTLRVTAAHEFFHAVQFAYDWAEDVWFMEGTATWVEDEVYDDVDDNRQYLSSSALSHPATPVDFVQSDGFEYGSWIFWRYLSETVGRRVVEETWARAVGARSYSLAATRAALSARRRDFGAVFARFGAANLVAKRSYSEGGGYRQARPRARYTLERRRPSTGNRTLRTPNQRTGGTHPGLDHLSSGSVFFQPGSSLRGRWRLRISLDLPPRARGSRATVMLHRSGGGLTVLPVRLDWRGDATLSVPFAGRRVSAVSLTLTNASTRMKGCGTVPTDGSYWVWSCNGWSLDDGLPFRYQARAVR